MEIHKQMLIPNTGIVPPGKHSVPETNFNSGIPDLVDQDHTAPYFDVSVSSTAFLIVTSQTCNGESNEHTTQKKSYENESPSA